MNILKTKIVADSACDIFELPNISFETAPLKIITTQKEYVDNEQLDVLQMVDDLKNYKGKSSTSCPNVGDWIDAFGDAQYIFCVTITGTLSGSYNSAILAKQTYEEMYPDRHIFVLDSLTAGPEINLIIEKLQELIISGKKFDEICKEIKKYRRKTGLIFMLESMKNLANNGRVSPIVAKMAGLFGVRLVGKASDKGDLEPIDKCRGEKNALENIVENLKTLGLSCGGKVMIAHCFNEQAGLKLKELVQKSFSKVQVVLYECRGLCSFYAEKGGLLVGFEKAIKTE